MVRAVQPVKSGAEVIEVLVLMLAEIRAVQPVKTGAEVRASLPSTVAEVRAVRPERIKEGVPDAS